MGPATGWAPRVGVREGVRRLHDWLRENSVKRRAVTVGSLHPGSRAWVGRGHSDPDERREAASGGRNGAGRELRKEAL